MTEPSSENIAESRTFVFDDPRLRMTIAGRLLVRVVTAIWYVFLIAAAVTFLISGIPHIAIFGIFLSIVLVDRFIRRRDGDRSIAAVLQRKGRTVNIAGTFKSKAYAVMEQAFDRSSMTREDFYLEVARRIVEVQGIADGLRRLDVDPGEFKNKLEDLLKGSRPAIPMPDAKKVAQEAVRRLALQAFREAAAAGHRFVKLSDIFSALADIHDARTDRLFSMFSIDPRDMRHALILSSVSLDIPRLPHALGGFASEFRRGGSHRVMNRAWTSRPTPTLDRYGTDVTDLARLAHAGFLVGHEEEYQKLIEVLARPTDRNAILVGDAGVGKNAIIEHLAFALIGDEVPNSLFDLRLVSLDMARLVAGASPEEMDARITKIVDEIVTAGNIILSIPDIHNIVKSSSGAYLTAADALMPVIESDAFPVIGTSYPREFKQLIEPRSDVIGSFEVIPVNEISLDDAETVLTYESLILEKEHHIIISFGAIKRAVVLAKRYLTDKFLPASAEELIKSSLIAAEARGEKMLGPDLVTSVAEAKVHIPLHEADQGEAQKLLHLEEIVHGRLIGQDEAVTAVAEALREYRSGLARQKGPIASFLFVGPTGVGKTELAKVLADVQFGSEKMMVRFDMTEYQDKESFIRFIGSPDGRTDGALTEAIRKRPYGLILLDEFEKAFPDILDLFLQVFDDGRLTDNMGRTIDFANTIIIATSNAHSDIINEALGKGEGMSQVADYLKARLTDIFKPELLNRFSKIVIFKDLSPADLRQIVRLNLNDLTATVEDQGISLDFDDSAIAEIVRVGYDPAFGARPLRRAIDEKIKSPLSSAILGGTVKKGDRVKVVFENGAFSFLPIPLSAA
jgi:ATP-dependent Clp protease ATP-binding subunit ClpC